MTDAPISRALQHLLGPFPASDFFASHYGREWLHVGATDDPRRFETLVDRLELERLLALNGLWDERKLRLSLDGRWITPDRYCMPAGGSDTDGRVWRPVPERVMRAVSAGATLVVNGLDGLILGLNEVAKDLESALMVRVQSNLYLSSAGRQGLPLHFDPHDVLALQISGSKRWCLHGQRLSSPASKMPLEADLRRAAGPVAATVTAGPGDLLYLPAGLIHEAVAESDWSMHLTISLKQMTRMDLAALVMQRLGSGGEMTAPLYDLHQGAPALQRHLGAFSNAVANLLSRGDTAQEMLHDIALVRRPRTYYSLPTVLTRDGRMGTADSEGG